MQCLPLYSLMLAVGRTRVDFLSLDVEGAEVAVLGTVPWDEVDIAMVMVEVEHSDRTEIGNIMEAAGYAEYKIGSLKENFISATKDLFHLGSILFDPY